TLRQRWRELNPDQRESFLALISSETERLAALVGDVLDASRIDAGTFTYRFADVDLGALVRDSVAGLSLTQEEVSVVADVHGELPSVRGDRDRLQQVLTNLLDNAVKFSPAGEEVRVSAFQQDSRVRIEVSDRGPGVPPAQQRSIGDPRAQLLRLAQNRLAAEREDLADQPVLAADCDLFDRRAVLQQPRRAALEPPARDLGRVPDLDRSGVAQAAGFEALARLEVVGEHSGA